VQASKELAGKGSSAAEAQAGQAVMAKARKIQQKILDDAQKAAAKKSGGRSARKGAKDAAAAAAAAAAEETTAAEEMADMDVSAGDK